MDWILFWNVMLFKALCASGKIPRTHSQTTYLNLITPTICPGNQQYKSFHALHPCSCQYLEEANPRSYIISECHSIQLNTFPNLTHIYNFSNFHSIIYNSKSIMEKAMAPHSTTLLPGKSHGRRSLVGCSPWGHWELDTTERLHFHFSLSCIGGGNGNPFQFSCLENPRDDGAWWAAVYGVAHSQTRLTRLSSSSKVHYE